MIGAICFDLDGTLVEYEGDFDALLDSLRVDLGLIACDFRTFRDRVASALAMEGPVTLASALTRALRDLGLHVGPDVDEVADRATRTYAASIRERPGAAELLEECRRARLPLAVVTNGPYDMQKAAVESAGLAGYFQALVVSGAADVARRKPHPAIFALACKRLGTDPARTLMVGDDFDKDVRGARAAGMPAVLIGDRPGEGFETIADLARLGEWLQLRGRTSD